MFLGLGEPRDPKQLWGVVQVLGSKLMSTPRAFLVRQGETRANWKLQSTLAQLGRVAKMPKL